MAGEEVNKEDKPKFDPNFLAKQYARYYEIIQRDGEDDDLFRSRVAGELRQKGHIIEAHEAYSGRRYDDPEQGSYGPMAGIMGAVAQAMQGRRYSPNDPERQIGDDIAAGIFVQAEEDPTRAFLRTVLDTFGAEAGVGLILGMSGEKRPRE